MIEVGQASVLIPVILRHWLDDKFIRPDLIAVIKSYTPQFLSAIPDGFSASDMIVLAFWNIVKSNMQVCRRQSLIILRSDFFSVVLIGRKSIQFLFHIAAAKTGHKPDTPDTSQLRQHRSKSLASYVLGINKLL